MKNLMNLLFVMSCFIVSCGDDDEDTTLPVEPAPVEATCADGIRNQDEEDIDCGGVCT